MVVIVPLDGQKYFFVKKRWQYSIYEWANFWLESGCN